MRVSHIPAGIGKSQAHGLDLQVQAVGGERVGRQVKPFEDVQSQQRGNPLPVGRAFPQTQTGIGRGNRLIPGAERAPPGRPPSGSRQPAAPSTAIASAISPS